MFEAQNDPKTFLRRWFWGGFGGGQVALVEVFGTLGLQVTFCLGRNQSEWCGCSDIDCMIV